MSNLSRQFDGALAAYEASQRRRYARKQESGFVGAGYGYMNGTLMMPSLMSGTPIQTQSDEYRNPIQDLGQNLGDTVSDNSGLGYGGTASSGV
jgi:hypothetical protein